MNDAPHTCPTCARTRTTRALIWAIYMHPRMPLARLRAALGVGEKWFRRTWAELYASRCIPVAAAAGEKRNRLIRAGVCGAA